MNKNPNTTKPPSILVIDDEQTICDFFVYVFEGFGIKIDTKQSGKSGVEIALEKSYSLIFSDVKLGDMSGIDVLKKIKNNDPSTKVVIISGYLTESLIKKALDLGADGYLYKPLVVRDVVSLTHKFLDPSAFVDQTDVIK